MDYNGVISDMDVSLSVSYFVSLFLDTSMEYS